MNAKYLTEAELGEFLNERFSNFNIKRTPTIKLGGKNYKPDYLIEELKLIVEFDGYRHYTNPKNCLSDLNRSDAFEKYGYDFIQIPYFIQLDCRAITILFHKYLDKILSTDCFSLYPMDL